jgi:hypothetical protein
MSEYQYYDFRAVDRPLDKRAMAALRNITSRAEITPTSLVNEYHFGDFKGDPDELMDRYFDAFVYVANWGTHRFMLRLPKRLFGLAVAKPYCVSDILQARATKEHIILDFCSEEEEGLWEESGEGWLDALIPLRSDLLNGDLRCLYLAWLSGIEYGAADEEGTEPPVPAGLNRLTASLERFAEFLRLDSDLLEVAAAASSGTAPIGPSADELASWVAELPEAEKNKLLLRLIEGDASHLGNELLLKFRQSRGRVGKRSARKSAGSARRTVASLRAARDARTGEKGGDDTE